MVIFSRVTAACAELRSCGPSPRQVLLPLDLEQRFGMIDGDIFHGAPLDRSALLAQARHGVRQLPSAPLAGLYLRASGAHPGAGDGRSARPQRAARRDRLRDFKKLAPRPARRAAPGTERSDENE